MLGINRLEEAHEAFGQRAWRQARSAFAAVSWGALSLDGFERYAIAAHLVGDDAESRELLARGHRRALARDDVTRAVRFAFWLGHSMIFTGQLAQANGWWERARSLLTNRGVDCAPPLGWAGRWAGAALVWLEVTTRLTRRLVDPPDGERTARA